ncbi:MAG: hypothetical protein INE97_06490 [Phenylobacterium sp.]|nr:hypothetical protein [Phenylobacterium sp.]
MGLSTGSLYHRFGSREGLLGETWLNALLAFQPVFVQALKTPSAVGEIAAVTPRFCRERRSEHADIHRAQVFRERSRF